MLVANESDRPVWFDEVKLTVQPGLIVQETHYDPWGMELAGIEGRGSPEHSFKFQGKELIDELELYLMDFHARYYDAQLGRWHAVDPANQFGSPYLAMGNNPVVGVDPDGEFVFTAMALLIPGAQVFLPWAIGADIGMWQGGTLANGTANPLKWDYSSGKTWGYMAGGAAAGGLSGGAANAVATSGMAFANTAAIATGSLVNSVGTYAYTGGQTDISVSFGAASYNFSQGKLGHLGKKENSFIENLGYGLGALTNLSDYIDFRASGKAAERLATKDVPMSDEQIRQNSRSGWRGRNYLGPSGNANPELRFRQIGIGFMDDLDELAYVHDVDYYFRGADGIPGALFSKRVMAADIALARGAREVLRNSAGLSSSTRLLGIGVNYAFTGIYGFKTAMSHSYLYPWMMK